MKEEYQRKHILARGKEVFIGIDVHKESWQVKFASDRMLRIVKDFETDCQIKIPITERVNKIVD